MTQFVPCAGKQSCTEDGTHCRGCGRSHDEIARTRSSIDALCDVAREFGYDNVEAFAGYVARRINKKLSA
jgi:hypothetical protein